MDNLKRKVLYICIIFSLILLTACSNNSDTDLKDTVGSITGRLILGEKPDEDCDCECGIEDIKIRLYIDNCRGTFNQTAITDEEGFYQFVNLSPGFYCVNPEIPVSCEGIFPTSGINRIVEILGGEETDVEWFTYEYYIELENN